MVMLAVDIKVFIQNIKDNENFGAHYRILFQQARALSLEY